MALPLTKRSITKLKVKVGSNGSDKCHIARTLPPNSICIKGCATRSLNARIKMILGRQILDNTSAHGLTL